VAVSFNFHVVNRLDHLNGTFYNVSSRVINLYAHTEWQTGLYEVVGNSNS